MMQKSAYYRQQALGFLGEVWKPYVLATLIYMAISFGVSATGIGAVASIIIAGPFSLSLSLMSLKAIKGEEIEAMNIFSGFENFVNALILSLYQGLIVFLWSLLLIVPGILKSFSYSMTFYILAENPDIKAKEAMRESETLMQGHRWEYFKLHLSFIGWNILSIFTFGLLFLWLTPYMEIATAAFYQDLKMQKYGTVNPYGAETEAPQQPSAEQNSNDTNTLLGQIQYNVQPAETAEPEQSANESSFEGYRFDNDETNS